MNKDADLIVEIEDLAFGGSGVARHDGVVVFVPFTAVGDQVRVKIVRRKKTFWQGKLQEVIKPAPGRVEAPCPYFGYCGGCAYQHLDYETELQWKEKQLEDVLKRLGGLDSPRIEKIARSPEPYGYRNRISVHQQDSRIGFHSHNSGTLVDIQQCLLACDEVNEKLTYLRQHRGRRDHYSLRSSEVSGVSFHQANRYLLDLLKDRAKASVDSQCTAMLEGYAGAGFFTAAFGERIKRIVTIEEDTRAVEEARKLKREGLTQWAGRCEDYLEQGFDLLAGEKIACFVDPPREGLGDPVVQGLLTKNCEQLIYLSCQPATLARDVRKLAQVWEPVRFEPIDMFPRTSHIECLVVFKRV